MEGYRIQPATADAFKSVVALIKECQRADGGAMSLIEDIYAARWKTFDLERDVQLVYDDDQLVAMASVASTHPVQMDAAGPVHPVHRRRGIGTELCRFIDQRAREMMTPAAPGARVVIRQSVGHLNVDAAELLKANGYVPVRRLWEMAIDLLEELEHPTWPEGLRLATFEVGQEHAVYDATNEAFRDHWGWVDIPWERFRTVLDQPDFDPSLWFLAWAGDQIAGQSRCFVRTDGVGYVFALGVRRPWRRQGLGLALLLQSFGEFRRRGLSRAALHVDSENLSGATRLYERAGMHVVGHGDTYEKVLR